MRHEGNDGNADQQPFAAVLKSYRRAAHLTQEELAIRAGVSVRTVSGLESGTRHVPYKETVRLLAQALELAPQDAATFVAAARVPELLDEIQVAAPCEERCHAVAPIPAQVTPLFGRERELEAIGALLLRADVRLLTLHGPPGVGKTRLAIALAEERAAAFADGVYFVPLAPVHDSAHVLATLAASIGLRDTGNTGLIAVLLARLRNQRALLVLDNFEHVVEAAPLVTELLESCSNLKVVVTSREALRLRGEQIVPVPPLALPAADDAPFETVGQSPSVQLFLDRARRAAPAFALTVENAPAVSAICRRLDGLPLALELAAARMPLLTPERLLCRLEHRLSLLTTGARDLPQRQQTLRDALAWSYDLLDEAERALFRRFAVFAGGATLEAVHSVNQPEHVLGSSVSEHATLDSVQSLVNKSLLACDCDSPQGHGEPRMRMLETMREYAAELLAAHGEAEKAQRAHAAYFATFAEAAEDLRWPERVARYRTFEADLDNFRAALRWAMNSHEATDVELGLRLAGALGTFWYVNGHLSEGASWLRGLLARSAEREGACALAVRAKALYMGGWIAIDQGEYAKAAMLLVQSVTLYRQTGERTALALALHRCGDAVLRQGECERAEALFGESLTLRRQEGDAEGVAASLNNLAATAAQRKQYDRARELLDEAGELYESLGEQSAMMFVFNNQADLARECGDYAGAVTLCRRCIRHARHIGDAGAEAISLGILAYVAHDQGDDETAATHWRESLALQRAQGNSYAIAYCLHALADIERDQGHIEAALALYWESLELHQKMAVTRGAVNCLEGLASIAALSEQTDRAAELCGAIAALRESLGSSERPATEDAYERAVALARTALGEKRFAAAWSVGRHAAGQDKLASALAIASSIYRSR